MKTPYSIVLALMFFWLPACALAQDTVTGAFEGTVTNSLTGAPLANAAAEIVNLETGLSFANQTDARGRFYQGLLAPGFYRIRVTLVGYQAREVVQELRIARTGEVVPVPVSLDPAIAAPVTPTGVNPPLVTPPTTNPTPTNPNVGGTPTVTPASPQTAAASTALRASLNTTDARRSGSFSEAQIGALPLGGVTLTRSFDELALLLPGVAPPPQTLGSVAGPGQGAGVGTAGQFAVNGLRSRANNFTVDGSDNNDEDIGVRRQGFVALIPQPIESIREYQVFTLLAPAQFGRNIGAIVNAVSKSGGSKLHGDLYGFFNSSQLNARRAFDSTRGDALTALRAGNNQEVRLNGSPLSVKNGSGGEDSFTLAKWGATLGGPLRKARTFYFLSAEGQVINARQEASFAVPTVEQRGAFGTGATGIFRDPFTGREVRSQPNSANGNIIFSYFPFANDPNGIYGANTYTQTLPARARGMVYSAKLDENFKLGNKQQSITGRYNFTDDERILPVTGQAIFSSLQPEVRTQNLSLFYHSQLSEPNAVQPVFNQLRFSYGRTRLRFTEVRDQDCFIYSSSLTLPCSSPSRQFPNIPFLLNAPVLSNNTRGPSAGVPNTDFIPYASVANRDTESLGGALGQINIAGYSPVGVDVYNFPQARVNNTYQLADNLTWRKNDHSLAFGFDVRRTELNSDVPRLARPLATFNGAPRLEFNTSNNSFRPLSNNSLFPFVKPEDLAAFGAASNFFLTLTNGQNETAIALRFYQQNFYAQDEWRIRPNLTFSYGLRYEFNTVPRESQGRIENTFNNATALALVPRLRDVIGGRTQIYDADRNNFGPRVSLAYSPKWLGQDRTTVLRAGFGVFYDQILGAVVSQSRNVFPNFIPLNLGGLFFNASEEQRLTYLNPAITDIGPNSIVASNSVNRLNPQVSLAELVSRLSAFFPSALGVTLPERNLSNPVAYHYSVGFEQQLNRRASISFAYVGTQGRQLLRFSTPNLGPSINIVPTSFTSVANTIPAVSGRACLPSPSTKGLCQDGRVVGSGIGSYTIFSSSANSSYNSLQVELRSQFATNWQAQASYTLSSARDDVSDVFDLAGAYNLPQNSLTLAGERGPANFDIRHRGTYTLTYDLSALGAQHQPFAWLFKGLQLASLGRLQTGQPFTVNSIYDINLDGNLTDRLNTRTGLLSTGNGRQPIQINTTNLTGLLAAAGQDGQVARNSFRAAGWAEISLAINKAMLFSAQRRLNLRVEIFNLLNQANFAIPVRFLEASGFGKATDTVTPGLRVQLGLKYSF